LSGGDVPDGTNEVGGRDRDGGKFEVCDGVEERSQLRRLLLYQSLDVDDTGGRGANGEFDRSSGAPNVDKRSSTAARSERPPVSRTTSKDSKPEPSGQALAEARAVAAIAFDATELTSMHMPNASESVLISASEETV
jgi:hypothetical protein